MGHFDIYVTVGSFEHEFMLIWFYYIALYIYFSVHSLKVSQFCEMSGHKIEMTQHAFKI